MKAEINYISAVSTNIACKKTNEDAICLKIAETSQGKVVFLAICDGMGGFSKGELASTVVLESFSKWFAQCLPDLLEEGFSAKRLHDQWFELVQRAHQNLLRYSRKNHLRLGTTLTAMLMLEEEYYIVHVGDCRVYEISDTAIRQLTTDHTLVQKEVEMGRITAQQARVDKRRNMLLQCIGAGEQVKPDFLVGMPQENTCYMICCDGFRHELSDGELQRVFAPGRVTGDDVLENRINAAIQKVLERRERDNVTVGVVKRC